MKGRPILGAISGFFFGLLLGISLWLWGLVPLHSDLLLILPILGIVLGLVMAWWAPFGKSSDETPPVASPAVESMEQQTDSGTADPEPIDTEPIDTEPIHTEPIDTEPAD